MNDLRIEISGSKTKFLPGEELKGRVSWWLEQAPEAVELRLFWFTRGKGDEDVEIIESTRYDACGTQGSRDFQFKCPDRPYSFTGKLITLTWGLELVVDPSGDSKLQELIIGPGSAEIDLYRHYKPPQPGPR